MKRIDLKNDFEEFLIANEAYEKFIEAILTKNKFNGSIDAILTDHYETVEVHMWVIAAFTWTSTGEFEFWAKLNNKWEDETKDVVDFAGNVTINKL